MSKTDILTTNSSQIEQFFTKSSYQLQKSTSWLFRQVQQYSSEFSKSAESALTRAETVARKFLIHVGEFFKTAEGKGLIVLGIGLSIGRLLISKAESSEYSHKPLIRRVIQTAALAVCIFTGILWAAILKV